MHYHVFILGMKGLKCIYNCYDNENNENYIKYTLDLLYMYGNRRVKMYVKQKSKNVCKTKFTYVRNFSLG